MTIRAALAADAAAICAIWNPVIRDTAVTFNPVEKTEADIVQAIAARADDGHAFLVAEAGGAVAGFVQTVQFRGGLGYRHTAEHTIILAAHAHGRGVGRALLAAAEAHAAGIGCHSLIAGVSAENPAGVAFHARCGFAQVARLPQVGFKFGRWMDLIVMQKFLASR